MRSATARPLLLLAGLLVVVGLPVTGRWARRHSEPRCALDGLRIEPLYRVHVVDRAGASHYFCCVRCAGSWLEQQRDRPAAIYVTDEADGRQLDARSAHFVRSTVVTNPITRNRVHVFRDPADAQEHARAFGGEVLAGAGRPFAGW